MKIVRFATHPDAGRVLGHAIVLDEVGLKSIAMAGHRLGLVAEADPRLVVQPYLISSDEIVRVFVANRNAKAPVAFEHVVLKDAVPHTPAEKQAVLAVVAGLALFDQGPLRSAAGVETERGIVLADAVADDDVVRLLEADTVACKARLSEPMMSASLRRRPLCAAIPSSRSASASEADVRRAQARYRWRWHQGVREKTPIRGQTGWRVGRTLVRKLILISWFFAPR